LGRIWFQLVWIVKLNHMDAAESGQAGHDPHVHHRLALDVKVILNLFTPGTGQESSDKQNNEDCTNDEDESDVWSRSC